MFRSERHAKPTASGPVGHLGCAESLWIAPSDLRRAGRSAADGVKACELSDHPVTTKIGAPLGCEICAGSASPGWVCEEHADRPFEHDGCGGAGMKCVCNPMAAVQWKVVFAGVPNNQPLNQPPEPHPRGKLASPVGFYAACML